MCGGKAVFYRALEGGTYFRCQECRGLFLHPTPTLDEMRAYAEGHYRDGVYAEYVAARSLKLATFRERLRWIKKYKSSGKLLDLGCACGFMIEAALEAGFDASGVEFSEEAIRAAAPSVRDRIRHGDINRLPAGEFDVITAFDILEHAQDPIASLREWAGFLRPGGLLVVASPDTDSILRKVMGSRWPMLQPFQHTFLFSGSRFGGVLARAGLKPLEVREAKKVMTIDYLIRQLRIYFPRTVKVYQAVRKMFLGATAIPIPFRIGEFLAIAEK
jgi:SAM-dependent methyltransferase